MSGPPIPVPINEIKRRIKEAGFEILYYDTREFTNPTVKDIVRFHVSQFEPILRDLLFTFEDDELNFPVRTSDWCNEHMTALKAKLLPFIRVSLVKVVASLYNPVARANEPPCPHKWFVLDQNPRLDYPCIRKSDLNDGVDRRGNVIKKQDGTAKYPGIVRLIDYIMECFPQPTKGHLRKKKNDLAQLFTTLKDNECKNLVSHVNDIVQLMREGGPEPPPGPLLPPPEPPPEPPQPGPGPPPPFQPPGPPDINTPEFKARYPNLSGLLLIIKEWVKPIPDATKNRYRTQIETYLKEMSDEEIALFRPMPEFTTILSIRTRLPVMYKGKPFKAKLIGGRRYRSRRTRKLSRS